MDDDAKEIADRAFFDRIDDEERFNKALSYLEQENAVLHEKLRKLEISLAAEREACAKVAEDWIEKSERGLQASTEEADINFYSGSADAAVSIADMIRQRP